jgi:hypothetical protein
MERIAFLILMSWLGLYEGKKVVYAIGAFLLSNVHIEIVIGSDADTNTEDNP